MPVTLPDPQLPGDPQDALQSIQRNFEALSLLSPLPLPTGTVLPYAAGTSPAGFRLCNGDPLSTSAFPKLFALIGYTYGGSAGTFNLPDLRGRLPVGQGSNASVSTLGLNDGTAEASRRPAHSHTASSANATTGITIPSGGTHGHTITDPGHDHYSGTRSGYTNTEPAHNHTTYGNQVTTRQGTAAGGVVTTLGGSGNNTGTTSSNGSHGHNVFLNSVTTGVSIASTTGSHSHTITEPNSGQGHSHTISVGVAGTNDAPSFLVLTYIIKT